MHLEEILNVSRDDAIIAERVFKCTETEDPLLEATARILRFNYERAKNDPRPRVLVLGRWLHTQTGNKLIVGINLNYLDEDEVEQLNRYLPQIMNPSSLKVRWWTGYGLLPQIWSKAYRQYDERFVHGVGSANIDPEPKDFEKPKDPGDVEELPPDVAAQVQKIKQKAAKVQEKPPHEPKKKRSIDRFSADTLMRIAKFIKSKLTRNKRKELAQKQADKIEAEPEIIEPEIIEPELDDPETQEAEQELERAQETQKLQDIEKEYKPKESFIRNLDTLIEATVEPKKLMWRSPANYIYWHNPEKFAEYQPRLRGRVLDYAHGTKLIAAYNIIEDKLIIDLVESPHDILISAGWDWYSTIRMTADNGELLMEHDIPIGESVFIERAKNHDCWGILQEAANLQ